MIIDATMFFDETELFCLRLEHLKDVVSKHFVLESSVTHTGHPKPFRLDMSNPRIAPYRDKIVLIRSTATIPTNETLAPTLAHWIREFFQRDILRSAVLACAGPGDKILFCDLDQFPRLEKLAEAESMADAHGVACIEMINLIYYLNRAFSGNEDGHYRNPLAVKTINNARLVTAKFAIDPPAPRPDMNEVISRSQSYRIFYFHDPAYNVNDCGWHFSSCGGRKSVIEKLSAYAHAYDDGVKEWASSLSRDWNHEVGRCTEPYPIDALPACVHAHLPRLKAEGFIRDK
jgi:hypothetical protein